MVLSYSASGELLLFCHKTDGALLRCFIKILGMALTDKSGGEFSTQMALSCPRKF